MKKKILAITTCLVGGLAMVIPTFIDKPVTQEESKEVFVDNVSYDQEEAVAYLKDFTPKDDGEVKIPNKVILHYHNDDNACLTRRFYTWVTGVDGSEKKPDEEGWSSTDMKITLDFDVLTDYKDAPSLFFIIKVAGTWAGQSDDIEIDYKNYQDAINEEGVLELWTTPAEGKAIDIFLSEEASMMPKITTAKFTDWKTIHCTSTIDKDGKKWVAERYTVYAYDRNYLISTESVQKADKEFYKFKEGVPSGNEFDIKFNFTAKINIQYVIESVFPGFDRVQKIVVGFENLYEDPRFEQFYTYSGNDLGMTYSPSGTTFKVWSPISAAVTLNLYDNGAPAALGGSDSASTKRMYYKKGGVWELTVADDIKGSFYTFTFVNANGTVETIDPYVKATGINGLRGYVYDKDSAEANPEGWDDVPAIWDKNGTYDIASSQDLSIYEIHIRDLTMDKTWKSNKGNKNGTYGAFIESGTTYTQDGKTVTTGFDHIEELGVNAIQILPVFDNDNDERPDKMKFNWGYNPLNYNVVEGGYSSDPFNPLTRIVEYKELVKAYARVDKDNHTRVIMDVVYNHVSSASASCFNKIMPKYYFRYDSKWNMMDGSGCNNEVKSDSTMMRKYIVDSLSWWATEYKIKGFRFDLMGLIDTWTMRACKEAMHAIDPDIFVYGEGWTSGGYHGKYQMDGDKLVEGGSENSLIYSSLYESNTSPGKVGGFNNGGRDNLKGSNDNGYIGSPYPQFGFISQGDDVGDKADRVGDMIRGVNCYCGGANPAQTVNYASCHDNYTLWDQLRYTLAPNGYKTITTRTWDDQNKKWNYHENVIVVPNGTTEPATTDLVNATIAAHASVFMSNGASFIQGGEELYRSKTYETDEELAEVFDGTKNIDNVVRPFSDNEMFTHYVHPNQPDAEDLVAATSEVYMYGKVTSHNSYKSGDNINAFKWDRKIAVNGTSTYEYNQVWSQMVHAKAEFKKYSYGELYPSGDLDTSLLNTWSNGNGSNILAGWLRIDQNTGFHFFFSGRVGASISCSNDGLGDPNRIVFATDKTRYSYSAGTVTLQAFTFVCVRVNG